MRGTDSEARQTMRPWLARLLTAGLCTIAFAPLGCSSKDAPTTSASTAPETSTTLAQNDVELVTSVVDSLKPGEPAGFDPQAWSDAVNQQAVLPPGATLTLIRDSVVVTGNEASVDVTMEVPGQPATRNWLFLHKLDGEWLIYGTLPLDTSE